MRGGAIRGNVASAAAGGLANAGDTTLNNASVDGNDSEEFGGGIMTLDINGRTGPLRLNSTQVSGNIASLPRRRHPHRFTPADDSVPQQRHRQRRERRPRQRRRHPQ